MEVTQRNWEDFLPTGRLADESIKSLVPSNVLESASSIRDLVPHLLKNGEYSTLDAYGEDSDPIIEQLIDVTIVGTSIVDHYGEGGAWLILSDSRTPVGWWVTTTHHQALCNLHGQIVWRSAWRRVSRWWGDPSPPDRVPIKRLIALINK